MSSYLCFRKNGVDILSFSRNTKVYEAFPNSPCDGEWHEITPDKLRRGIENLECEIVGYNALLEKSDHVLKYLTKYEDIQEEVASQLDIKEEIKEYDNAIHTISLLIDMCEEFSTNKPKMEWGVF